MKDFRHLEPSEYVRIPWRRRWYFLGATLLAFSAVLVYALVHPIRYRSETRISVDSPTLLDDPLSPNSNRDRTEERVNAIRQSLESRTTLEQIIAEYRLQSGAMKMEDALLAIRGNLDVTKASGSTFTMAYYDEKPENARSICARLADILVSNNQRALKARVNEKELFIDRELQQARQDLALADENISNFKAKNWNELPEQGNLNLNVLSGFQTQLMANDSMLDRAREQQRTLDFRLQEQKKLSAMAKNLAANERTPVPDVKGADAASPLALQLMAKRTQLREYASKYTAGHPDVVRLTKEVADLELQIGLKNVPQATTPIELTPLGPVTGKPAGERGSASMEMNMEAEIAQAQFELNGLKETIAKREKEHENIQQKMNVYQKRLNLAPNLQQELLALTRDHETKRQQVADLQQRKFNAQMATNAIKIKSDETYGILDPASLPERPMPPTRLQIVLIGIAASLGAGLAAAFGRELLESSFASEEEAAAILKIPILVCIPEIRESSRPLLN